MPAPFPQGRRGHPIANPPSGFPLFFDKRKPRIVTANPWAFLRHIAASSLESSESHVATALIEQAYDFSEAARNPRLGSKPLLHYYSFLNLAKSALLIKGVHLPPDAFHGIRDPRANTKKRLRLPGQLVKAEPLAKDHSRIFPEFVKMLGGDASKARQHKILDLLSQLPTLHRTYTLVTKKSTSLLPIRELQLMRDTESVWCHLSFDRKDRDVATVLPRARRRRPFRATLHQVRPCKDGYLCFETSPVKGRKKATDKAIAKLAAQLRATGISSIFTRQGYRFYISSIPKRLQLPPLAAGYAVMFYLGAVTRYKPDVFDKLIAGGYSWLVDEFLSTYPVQFLHTLASELAGVDVVQPYAVTYIAAA